MDWLLIAFWSLIVIAVAAAVALLRTFKKC